MTITRKLLIPTLLGILAAIGVLVFVNLDSQKRLIVERENAQWSEAYAHFTAQLSNRALLAEALAISVSNMPSVKEYFAALDREKLLQLMQPLFREASMRYRVVHLQFHLPAAVSFLRVNKPEHYGDDVSTFRHTVVQANALKSPQTGLEVGRTGVGLRGVVPIAHGSRYIGTVEFGIGLDDYFLERFKVRTGAEGAVYLSRQVVRIADIVPIAQKGTSPLPDLELIVRTSLEAVASPELFTRALQGLTTLDRVEFNAKPYVVGIGPIHDYHHDLIGAVQICLPRGNVLDKMADTRNASLILGGLIGLVVVAGIGGLIVRTIIHPLAQLTQGVHRLREGDRKARVRISGRDELGQLGRAFNSMADEIVDLMSGLEQRVEERTRELTKANQELERFVYTVSHDLKSPLITIRGFLGYVEKAAIEGDMEGMKTDIARISDATDKMHQLLDELLELSRIGRIMNPPENVSLGELANEAVRMVAGRLGERNVQVDIAPDLPQVHGDRPRLREMLQNLLDNAVKYTGDQSNPRVEIGLRFDGVETVFFVRDNGMGIDPRYHTKVFGLFEKLEHKTEGSGVGLAIVKRIVEVHGGNIWVESEGLGKGCTFCFTLPPATL